MGAADRLALGCPGSQWGIVELVPELAQRLRHPIRPSLAVHPVALQAFGQHRIVMVDHVAEDVLVSVLLIQRRDLDRRDQPQAELRGRVGGLLDAVDAVVV